MCNPTSPAVPTWGMCEGTLCDLIGSCGVPWQHHSLEVGLWVLSGEALVKMKFIQRYKEIEFGSMGHSYTPKSPPFWNSCSGPVGCTGWAREATVFPNHRHVHRMAWLAWREYLIHKRNLTFHRSSHACSLYYKTWVIFFIVCKSLLIRCDH